MCRQGAIIVYVEILIGLKFLVLFHERIVTSQVTPLFLTGFSAAVSFEYIGMLYALSTLWKGGLKIRSCSWVSGLIVHLL